MQEQRVLFLCTLHVYVRGYIDLYLYLSIIFYFMVWYFRAKGKTRATPTEPNQPSEALAHFMFELAKSLLSKAGGSSSTSVMFTQVCCELYQHSCKLSRYWHWYYHPVLYKKRYRALYLMQNWGIRGELVLFCGVCRLVTFRSCQSCIVKTPNTAIFQLRMQPNGHILLRWNAETQAIISYYNMKRHLYCTLQSTTHK